MTLKSKRIHLIERDYENRMIKVGEKLWESGYWDIPESKAKQLLEGSVLFHKKQKEPSFFGGIILNFRIQGEGKWKGRVIFSFEYRASHRGVLAEAGGWSQEMKIITRK